MWNSLKIFLLELGFKNVSRNITLGLNFLQIREGKSLRDFKCKNRRESVLSLLLAILFVKLAKKIANNNTLSLLTLL